MQRKLSHSCLGCQLRPGFCLPYRLYFRSQVKGETERERLLLAFQTSGEIVAGRFPVTKELALEMAALMAQVSFFLLEKPETFQKTADPVAAGEGSALERRDSLLTPHRLCAEWDWELKNWL